MEHIYTYLKLNYPESLPPLSKIKSYSDIVALKLSHFNGDIISNMLIDLNNTSHVQINNKLIITKEYIKLAVKHIRYIDLIDIYLSPKIIPQIILPSLKIQYADNELPAFFKKPIITHPNINSKNHYTISSFDIQSNHKQLSEVIQRLSKTRDDYSTIHFHLEGNGGGDLIPVHFIILCLCGGKQKWMTNYEVSETNNNKRKTRNWDPWSIEPTGGYDEQYKKLNIKNLSTYPTPYSGKIILHIDTENGSSAWFFITYLIYVFASKIRRYTKYLYGIPIKLGKASGKQIQIYGCSNTTSGDGNAVSKEFNLDNTKIKFKFPTQENLNRPIKSFDWNRFWIE